MTDLVVKEIQKAQIPQIKALVESPPNKQGCPINRMFGYWMHFHVQKYGIIKVLDFLFTTVE